MIGRTISRYRILEQLGEGGMGVVYKAEDTKLERNVALKFLAAHLLDDDEAKARFLREAKAAAALHHPNICPVYEIDEADGKTFLAMAFLKGETLEDRIAKGPLPLNDALDIARQVAEGLQAAHAEGIVHRDIKPANILVSPEGRATIMDFGLARLTEASKLTRADQTVGTAAYMSPEQMQGAEVDHRTDIWAHGCVLYEMVAGLRPFQGEYDQALAYEVVHEEPEPLTGVRAGVPMELEFIAGKCLAKEPNDRYESASELAKDLRTLAEKLKSGRSRVLAGATAATQATAFSQQSATLATSPQDSVLRRRLRMFQAAFGIAAALAVGLLAVTVTDFLEAPPERPLRRFTVIPENAQEGAGGWAAISPDGKHIAYISGDDEQTLWVRDIDGVVPRKLPQTEGAARPFWSPDSEFVAFGAGAELKKISVQGRTPITLCSLLANNFHGGAWSPDGERIVFGSGGPSSLFEVSARGGQAEQLFDHAPMEMGAGVTSPQFLPLEAGGGVLVFDVGNPTNRELAVRNLETGEWEALGAGAYPIYSPSGHILYQTDRHETGLWALPFSIETLKPTGEAFPIVENDGFPSVAKDGTLVSVGSRGVGLVQLVSRF